MFKIRIVILILVGAFQFSLKAAPKKFTEMPAVVHLNLYEQNDTNGFNLVREIPKLVYNYILEGKIRLFDSPKKEMILSAKALQSLEESNNVSFTKVENILFYELWSSSRRKTDFVVLGISFLAYSEKGKVSLGYIDLAESFSVFYNNLVPVNADGCSELSFLNAIYSRKFVYNLVQFGQVDFVKNINLSAKIKDQAFNNKKKINGLYKVPYVKNITLVLEKNLGVEKDITVTIYNQLETFFNNNRNKFMEIGGIKYYSPDYKGYIAISRIELVERWEKINNKIIYKPIGIKIFANNKELDFVPISKFDEWQLLFNFKSIDDVVNEKQYLFTLYKINTEYIAPNETGLYLKAITEYKWSQINTYVKYSRN